MLKYAVNICLISFFVLHLANAGGDAINGSKNRRVKRLGVGSRNATQKFKKGETNLRSSLFYSNVVCIIFSRGVIYFLIFLL